MKLYVHQFLDSNVSSSRICYFYKSANNKLQCSRIKLFNQKLPLFFCLTVPSMPLNFNLERLASQPTQLSASWSEPLPANGIITAYTLTCSLSSQQFYPEQSNTEPSSIVTTVQDGSTTSATVEGLAPFTNYDCFVTADTSVGEGDPSSTETQRTDESGEC